MTEPKLVTPITIRGIFGWIIDNGTTNCTSGNFTTEQARDDFASAVELLLRSILDSDEFESVEPDHTVAALLAKHNDIEAVDASYPFILLYHEKYVDELPGMDVQKVAFLHLAVKRILSEYDNRAVTNFLPRQYAKYILTAHNYPIIESEDDEIGSGEVERACDDLADASAAQTWSTPSDTDIEKHGEDMLIIAEFGDWVACNGDVVWAKGGEPGTGGRVGDVDIPEGFEVFPDGGAVPTTEEHVSVDHVADNIALRLGLKHPFPIEKMLLIERAVRQRFEDCKDQIAWGSSGRCTYWAKRKPDEEES